MKQHQVENRNQDFCALLEPEREDETRVLHGEKELKEDNSIQKEVNIDGNRKDIMIEHKEEVERKRFEDHKITELLSMEKDVEECYGKGAFK